MEKKKLFSEKVVHSFPSRTTGCAFYACEKWRKQKKNIFFTILRGIEGESKRGKAGRNDNEFFVLSLQFTKADR